jgi:hypothetical protein
MMDQRTDADEPKAATDLKAALDFIGRWFGASKSSIYLCSLPNDKGAPKNPVNAISPRAYRCHAPNVRKNRGSCN